MIDALTNFYTGSRTTRLRVYAYIALISFTYGVVNSLVLGRERLEVSRELILLVVILTIGVPVVYVGKGSRQPRPARQPVPDAVPGPQSAAARPEQLRPAAGIRIATRTVDDVTIIDLAGRVTLGEGSGALREILQQLLTEGRKKIILNLGDVSYIDSSGIGELVAGFTMIGNAGGELRLVGLTSRIKGLLQLKTTQPVFDNEQAAIRSFQQA